MCAPPPCSPDPSMSIPPFAPFFWQLTDYSLFYFVKLLLLLLLFWPLSSFPCSACNFPYFLVCLLFVIIYLLVFAHFVGATLRGFTQTIPLVFWVRRRSPLRLLYCSFSTAESFHTSPTAMSFQCHLQLRFPTSMQSAFLLATVIRLVCYFLLFFPCILLASFLLFFRFPVFVFSSLFFSLYVFLSIFVACNKALSSFLICLLDALWGICFWSILVQIKMKHHKQPKLLKQIHSKQKINTKKKNFIKHRSLKYLSTYKFLFYCWQLCIVM